MTFTWRRHSGNFAGFQLDLPSTCSRTVYDGLLSSRILFQQDNHIVLLEITVLSLGYLQDLD
jgi:hypothetical protein